MALPAPQCLGNAHSSSRPAPAPRLLRPQQHASQRPPRTQARRLRRPQISAVYAQHGPERRELERPSALALSCTERPAAAAADLLAGLRQPGAASAQKRLRIAVDVDEGADWHAHKRCQAAGHSAASQLAGSWQRQQRAPPSRARARMLVRHLQCWAGLCTRSTRSARTRAAWTMACRTTGSTSLPRRVAAGQGLERGGVLGAQSAASSQQQRLPHAASSSSGCARTSRQSLQPAANADMLLRPRLLLPPASAHTDLAVLAGRVQPHCA